MASPLLTSSLFIVLSFVRQSVTANFQFCPPSACSPESLRIRFPFGLNSDNPRCTYPGFDLSCSNESQTMLHLPFAGDFFVTHFDYQVQEIRILDPGNCIAARFLSNFSLAETPFFGDLRSAVFLNCSARKMSEVPQLPGARYVACLSNENDTVLAVPPEFEDYARGAAGCGIIGSDVDVPVMWSPVEEGHMTLFWLEPDCTECERNGGICGFKDRLSYEIGCIGERSKAMVSPPLISSLFIFLTFLKQSVAANFQFCPPSACSPESIQIRFPFGLNSDKPRCTHPGFDLSCNNESQTILTLPFSGKFFVTHVDYQVQAIRIRDPGNCLGARFLSNFTLAGTPFFGGLSWSAVFLNCSARNISEMPPLPVARYVACLSNENDTVLAVPSEYEDYARGVTGCGIMASDVGVPVMWRAEADTALFWSEPDCTECEQNGGICGFKDRLGDEIGCVGERGKGLSTGAKYGLTIGAGIPGLLIIIGLGCYLCGRFRAHNQSLANPSTTDHLSTRSQLISINGLDGPTIELYPKTLLGESRRLPKPNDNTCPICLSEYQPKETLRTIPECNHYFHAECIDEWLKMNASCPLCRNSPDIGSIHTPTSSSSVATPSSSLSESSSSLYSGR